MFRMCYYAVQSIFVVATVVHLQSAVGVPCVVHAQREIYNEQQRQVYTHQRIDGTGGCTRYVYRIYVFTTDGVSLFLIFVQMSSFGGPQAVPGGAQPECYKRE